MKKKQNFFEKKCTDIEQHEIIGYLEVSTYPLKVLVNTNIYIKL